MYQVWCWCIKALLRYDLAWYLVTLPLILISSKELTLSQMKQKNNKQLTFVGLVKRLSVPNFVKTEPNLWPVKTFKKLKKKKINK